MVNVATHHAIKSPSLGLLGHGHLKVTDEIHRFFDLEFEVSRQRPVLQADARPEAVEVTVKPQGQLIQIIAQISQPLRALDHAIKVVAVNHPQLEAFGRGVGRVVQHLDPAKSVAHKMPRKLVVVARHINHAAPFARSAQ